MLAVAVAQRLGLLLAQAGRHEHLILERRRAAQSDGDSSSSTGPSPFGVQALIVAPFGV